MDLIKLAEDLVLSVVSDKDTVEVKEVNSNEEDTILLEILVSSDDMANVIGKNGRVINSIRTLLQATSYLHNKKNVKVNVSSLS